MLWHRVTHYTFSGIEIVRAVFEQIVRQCVEVGLVRGNDLSVDGSFVEANAAKESAFRGSSWWKRLHQICDVNDGRPLCVRPGFLERDPTYALDTQMIVGMSDLFRLIPRAAVPREGLPNCTKRRECFFCHQQCRWNSRRAGRG